jgi:hypothetical protein
VSLGLTWTPTFLCRGRGSVLDRAETFMVLKFEPAPLGALNRVPLTEDNRKRG